MDADRCAPFMGGGARCAHALQLAGLDAARACGARAHRDRVHLEYGVGRIVDGRGDLHHGDVVRVVKIWHRVNRARVDERKLELIACEREPRRGHVLQWRAVDCVQGRG
eukprot:3884719-Prymnesium_polylepis.1